MAWADGIIEPAERDAIFDIVNKICAKEFSREDVDAEIAAAENSIDDALSVSTRVGKMLNDQGRELILEAVFHIAASDGDFAREEQEMLMEIGAGLGLSLIHI